MRGLLTFQHSPTSSGNMSHITMSAQLRVEGLLQALMGICENLRQFKRCSVVVRYLCTCQVELV